RGGGSYPAEGWASGRLGSGRFAMRNRLVTLDLTSASSIRSNRPRAATACPGGGIGRRAGFRCQWLHGREGSSPFLGTTPQPKWLKSLICRESEPLTGTQNRDTAR